MSAEHSSSYSPDSAGSFFSDLLSGVDAVTPYFRDKPEALKRHGWDMFKGLPYSEQVRLTTDRDKEQAAHICCYMPPKYLWDGWHASTGYASSVSAFCTKHQIVEDQASSIRQNLGVLKWENIDGARQGVTVSLQPLNISAVLSVKMLPLTSGSIPLVSGSVTDKSIFVALMSEHTNQLNAAIIHELLLAATEQTTITVPSKDGNSNNVYDHILALSSRIAETTNQRSDVVIMSPRRWHWLLANTRLRSDNLIVPSEVTDTPSVPYPAGWIGPQKLPVCVDLNMQPNSVPREEGSEDKIIVACREDMHLFQPYYPKFSAMQSQPAGHKMFRFSVTTNQAYFSARLGNNTTGVIAGTGWT